MGLEEKPTVHVVCVRVPVKGAVTVGDAVREPDEVRVKEPWTVGEVQDRLREAVNDLGNRGEEKGWCWHSQGEAKTNSQSKTNAPTR